MVHKRIGYLVNFLILLSLIACQKERIPGSFEYQTLGESARELLSADPYTAIVVEISYMPGFAPEEATGIELTNFLQGFLDKPGGVSIELHPIAASGKSSLSLADIIAIEKKNRTIFTSRKTISVHALITDTRYKEKGIFGLSYWNTSVCIFGQPMYSIAGGVGQVSRQRVMSTTLLHEVGHLLGLVDQGSPMQEHHKDATHGPHCATNTCLMYYGIAAGSSIGTGSPQLDQHCRDDLRANGGK